MEPYEPLFEKRGVKFIRQYGTGILSYPSAGQIARLQNLRVIWKTGDRYYKLAAEYYGDAGYWWVIAHFNQKPTEAHVSVGDLIYIPLPLEKILTYIVG